MAKVRLFFFTIFDGGIVKGYYLLVTQRVKQALVSAHLVSIFVCSCDLLVLDIISLLVAIDTGHTY